MAFYIIATWILKWQAFRYYFIMWFDAETSLVVRFTPKSNAWIQSSWLVLWISLILLTPWVFFILILQGCHLILIASLPVIWSWLIYCHYSTFLRITHFPLVIIIAYSLLQTKEFLEYNLIIIIWNSSIRCLILIIINRHFLQLNRLMLIKSSKWICNRQLQVI
jgi:hypothetical protein